jgi:hypothetical protein
MYLLIDTNILLSFYSLAPEDLAEIRQLQGEVAAAKVQLVTTTQIGNEFYRNREQRLEGALKPLVNQVLNPQLPPLCAPYSELAATLQRAMQQYERAQGALVAAINGDIRAKALVADRLVADLLAGSQCLTLDPQIIQQAQLRMAMGNPPGKNNSLGDALNWECLLTALPAGATLALVSGDKDYASALNEEEFNGFLQDEWQRRNGGQLLFYRRLGAFFRDRLPHISLPAVPPS